MAQNHLLVAAIDFGTTFSGWAFSFVHEFKSDPTKATTKHWHAGGAGAVTTEKTPTCLLINPDGKTLEKFGYEAENEYIKLTEDDEHRDYYYFRRFKMVLNRKFDEGLSRSIKIEDEHGKELEAKLVFSLAIKYLKDDMIGVCKTRLKSTLQPDRDIIWVLTVPAIWNDAAKQFMREAAIQAGIKTEMLRIALEPEAASIYCRHIPVEKREDACEISKFPPGTKYMVFDAGGGTIDITIHEVKPDGGLREIHRASGGGWGGTLVDEEFTQLLIRMVGNPVYRKFKKQCTEDWLDLYRDFEVKKKKIDPAKRERITFRLPASLTKLFLKETKEDLEDVIPQTRYANQIKFVGDKMRCESQIMESLFQEPIDKALKHLQTLMRDPKIRSISSIIMVGGFSDSPLLKATIEDAYPDLRVIVPTQPELCVLRGAVIFGHNPASITERVMKYTYGFDATRAFQDGVHPEHKKKFLGGVHVCDDLFSKHVENGQTVRIGEAQKETTYNPVHKGQTAMLFTLYASEMKNPMFVTDGCTAIGKIRIEIPDLQGELDRQVFAQMIFGGTEIEVKLRDGNTGNEITKRFNFLG